jgi:hypothetical protein
MSNDFKKVLVKDPRLMVTDQLAYAVRKGGQSIVSQRQSAIAQSSSSVNFNVQIPSEQTVVDRRVWVKSTVAIQFQTSTNVPLVYGQNVSLAAFPFHQCASTVQTTLNNNVTSINIRDVLPFFVRSNDSRELSKACSSAPCKADSYALPSDSAGVFGQGLAFTSTAATNFYMTPQPNNNIGGWQQNIDGDITGNAAYAGYGSAIPTGSAPNTSDDRPVQLFGSTTSFASAVAQNPRNPTSYSYWVLVFTTIEPVLCQPFLWSDPVSNTQGIYGLQTVQLQYNMTNANRAFRIVDRLGGSAVTLSGDAIVSTVNNTELIFKYITPKPSDLLPARNVIPLLTYDRYFSNASLSASLQANFANTATLSSNTYNLTQVPDKICIFVRQKMSSVKPTQNDYVPTITNISLNFNNNAGLLSSATLQDLYYYSVKAGSNQSFNEFCGQANSLNAFVGAGATANSSEPLATVGSYLMLGFSDVIQLTEDMYAPGSLGNFQLQFNLTLSSKLALATSDLELVLVVVNSGIMVTDRGQTSTYTGILTKQDVLDASQQEPLNEMDVRRIVGSGHLDSGRALPMSVCNALLRKVGPLAEKGMDKAKELVASMSKRLM